MTRAMIHLAAAAAFLVSVPLASQVAGQQTQQGAQGGQQSQSSGKHVPGSLDMTSTSDPTPSEYAVLPLARGQKKEVKGSELIGDEVKGKDGRPIGSLEKLIMDTKTGKVEYGVVRFADTNETWPILWDSFKVNRDTGEVTLNLTRDQLQARTSIDDAKDLSPDIKKLMKDMRGEMGKPVMPGLGVQKQPASGGGQGEDQAATGGPSGPRGGPLSGQAPQFEGEGQKTR